MRMGTGQVAAVVVGMSLSLGTAARADTVAAMGFESGEL